jgi:DNA-directed RNA polymerase specialized sigma24 family protein
MNPILEYATSNRSQACGLVIRRYGIPLDDADDIVQDAMLRVLLADPDDINRQSYWLSALRSAALTYWTRRKLRPAWPFKYGEDGTILTDIEDRRQDCARQAEAAETIREACAIATPRERAAIAVAVGGERPISNKMAVRLWRLRRRLRVAAA